MLSLSLFILGCSKDGDKSIKLSADFLKQTSWEGKLTFLTGDEYYTVGMLFITEDRGQYETKYLAEDNSVSMDQFSYCVDKNLLTIECAYGLSGDWILTEISKNRMVLKRNIHSQDRTDILELKRTL